LFEAAVLQQFNAAVRRRQQRYAKRHRQPETEQNRELMHARSAMDVIAILGKAQFLSMSEGFFQDAILTASGAKNLTYSEVKM
jgi:hypothetical protein